MALVEPARPKQYPMGDYPERFWFVLQIYCSLHPQLSMALVEPARPKQYPMGVYPDLLSVCVAYVSVTASSATNGSRETNLAQTVSNGSLSRLPLGMCCVCFCSVQVS